MVVQDTGHLRVKPRHEPLGPLHHRGAQSARPERVRPLLRKVARLHFLGCRVDADHFLAGPHIQRQAPAKALRRLQQQAVPLRDGSRDVIRQPAVRERDLVIPLQHHDLGRLIQPPQPRSRRSASRDSPHDHRLHLVFPHVPSHMPSIYWISRAPAAEHHPCRVTALPAMDPGKVTDVTQDAGGGGRGDRFHAGCTRNSH